METFVDEVSDKKLLSYLQHKISESKNPKLRAIQFCGCGVLPTYNGKKSHPRDTVAVISNQEHAHLLGTMTCGSVWACPHCSPRVMAKHGSKIACAIDAMAKWHNQFAVMITFTIPHLKFMSANDTFTILQQTWRRFTRDKSKLTKTYTIKTPTSKHNPKRGTPGQKRIYQYNSAGAVYQNMLHDLKISHFIRVHEFTWGENSWHPHIHALYWIPAENFNKITAYEDKLLDRWWTILKDQATKFYTNKFPNKPEYVQRLVNTIYSDFKKHPQTGHKSVFISKDNHGKPIKQTSSMYISGWTGDAELAKQDYKQTHKQGHYTTRQILELAFANQNTPQEQKWLDLYIEYILATWRHIRVQFSRSGITTIIKKWMLSQEYFEVLKKKLSAREKPLQPWKVIVWFYRDEWSNICALNASNPNDHILSQLLNLARAPDIDKARLAILTFLENYGLAVHITGDMFVNLENAANFNKYAKHVTTRATTESCAG